MKPTASENEAGERPGRISRRTALKWLATAAAALPLLERAALGQAKKTAQGYGPDPDVNRTYKPGELWPLTFTAEQRRAVVALCDTIIPADAESPSASQVGVPDFLDEWVSTPYVADSGFSFGRDRVKLLTGLAWIDDEAGRRFGKVFADLDDQQKKQICDDICHLPRATPEFTRPAEFFARFRDLTAGGFYTSPEGTKDLKYVGNTPLATFDGPPLAALKHVGLA